MPRKNPVFLSVWRPGTAISESPIYRNLDVLCHQFKTLFYSNYFFNKNASLIEEFSNFTPAECGLLIDPGKIEKCD